MTCPHCGTDNSKIMDSGVVRDSMGERRYRRRLCKKCKERFTTYEFVEPMPKKYNPLFIANVERAKNPKPKKPPVPKKPRNHDWLQRILKMLDDTTTAEKIIRKEI